MPFGKYFSVRRHYQERIEQLSLDVEKATNAANEQAEAVQLWRENYLELHAEHMALSDKYVKVQNQIAADARAETARQLEFKDKLVELLKIPIN